MIYINLIYMIFSLEKEKNNLETIIYLYLSNNIEIDNMIYFKNMIIDKINNIELLNNDENMILSNNINYIIKNYNEYKKIILKLGIKLFKNINIIDDIYYINKENNQNIYKSNFVKQNYIFYTDVDNIILPLIWIYFDDFNYVKLYIANSNMILFNNFNIKNVPRVKKFKKIYKFNYAWIGV